MVYPVNSSIQPSKPAANTFQPGGTDAAKQQQPDQTSSDDPTRSSGLDTARSQPSETRNNGRAEDSRAFDETVDNDGDRYQDNGAISASSSRGTQLDVTA